MRYLPLYLLLLISTTRGQITQFPHRENFDSVVVPALPSGWSTSVNRTSAGDFTTTTSTPLSDPNAILATNASIGQTLTAPPLNFSSKEADSVTFYERRSGSHNSGLIVEASSDGGLNFVKVFADTLRNPGTTSYVRRVAPLPPSLSNLSTALLRWRVVGNGTGTSGTIRFDDITITARAQIDASIDSLRFAPSLPIVGDSVFALASFHNSGLSTITEIAIEFFSDINGDTIPQPNERIGGDTFSTAILPAESKSTRFPLGTFPFGEQTIMAQVLLAGDQSSLNDLAYTILTIGYLPRSVLLNEIMYAPSSPNPEWLEVWNATTDSINLRDWGVSDRNTNTIYRVDTGNIWIGPHRYSIFTRDTAGFRLQYPFVDEVAALRGMPSSLFNNDSDAVVFFDHRGAIMDSVWYQSSWGGTGGRSLERREPLQSSVDASNWGTSLHPGSATPARINSLTRKEYDVSVTSVEFAPRAPVAGENVGITATILNPGKYSAGPLIVLFFEDANYDSSFQPAELLDSRDIAGSILPGDSLQVSTNRPALEYGNHRFRVTVQFAVDEDTSNNSRDALILAGFIPGTVVVNEIMYAPSGAEPEWIELYNPSQQFVDLREWRIGNRTPSNRYSLGASLIPLPPLSYCIVTKDRARLDTLYQNIPALVIEVPAMPTFLFNNGGDAVVLLDSRGALIDSVRYSSSWGGTEGRSLERREAIVFSTDSTNWGSSDSLHRSSPGKQNYLTPLEIDLMVIRIAGTAFTTGEVEIDVVVQNVGKQPVSSFGVSLFIDRNADGMAQPEELYQTNQFGTIARNDSVEVTFTLLDAPAGRQLVIARAEALQDLRPSNNLLTGTINIGFQWNAMVINEIMYEPRSGAFEYIELYNPSEASIDLASWLMSDKPDTGGARRLTSESTIVPAGDFLVVAGDSGILRSFPYLLDALYQFVISGRFPGLNNDGDQVILTDLTGRTIDSIHYLPAWHNPNLEDVGGRALERINPKLPGNDSRNWSTSASSEGGTPGKPNSILTTSVPNDALLSFFPNPFSPDGDGVEDVTILRYRLPASASIVRVRIFDSAGRLIRTLADGEPSGPTGEIIWDGFNDGREKARIGIYIVLLDALNASGGDVQSLKGVVVVAARL